ncbi:MAG: hypothetical protein Q9183_007185 [Haloplaca sp. 2 TL-2023]
MGINEDHLEFTGRRGEWVFTNQAFRQGQNTKNESPVGQGHSTCTASKATGRLYGASKHATLVVVKMPDYSETSVIEVLFTAYQHIRSHGRQNRSVLVIPWASFKTYRDSTNFGRTERTIYNVLDTLSRIGVIILCAAGNYALEPTSEGLRTYVDTIPASFDTASPFRGSLKVANLLAVGNCDMAGRRAYDSQTLSKQSYTSHQIYAPGVGIRCADSISRAGSHLASGTSFSAPLVAGVLAEFLPLPDSVPDWARKSFLRRFTSRRSSDSHMVIWNQVSGIFNPPLGPRMNRLGGGSPVNSAGIAFNGSAADWPDTTLPHISFGIDGTSVA